MCSDPLPAVLLSQVIFKRTRGGKEARLYGHQNVYYVIVIHLLFVVDAHTRTHPHTKTRTHGLTSAHEFMHTYMITPTHPRLPQWRASFLLAKSKNHPDVYGTLSRVCIMSATACLGTLHPLCPSILILCILSTQVWHRPLLSLSFTISVHLTRPCLHY